MSAPNTNAAVVVYGSLRAAQASAAGKSGSSSTALPAFELYKVAREEELTAYRGLCRVLAMHYGADAFSSDKPSERAAAKHQRRLLEDLREVLAISEDRSDLELLAAAEDDIVKGVHRSGVLRRREDFYDGVEDVEVVTNVEEGRAADDGNTLYVPPSRQARTESYGGAGGRAVAAPVHKSGVVASAAGDAAASSKARAAAKKKLLASITALGQDAERLANTLLYSDDKSKESDAREQLAATREKLLELKEEISLES